MPDQLSLNIEAASRPAPESAAPLDGQDLSHLVEQQAAPAAPEHRHPEPKQIGALMVVRRATGFPREVYLGDWKNDN